MKTSITKTAIVAFACIMQVSAQTKPQATNNLKNNLRTGTQTEKLSIELRYVSNGIDRSADGVVAVYNNNYSNNVDANDAEQMANWDEDVALLRSNKELSIECRKLIDDYDTLF